MSANGVAYSYQDLEPRYKKIAETELNETPDRVRAHIASLRRWLQQCPHISNCPMDDHFLLRFLRISKFNQEKAQARLENYCTLRGSKERGLPQFFVQPALTDPLVEKFLNMGTQVPLGFNDRGEFLILVRFCTFDPDVLDIDAARPALMMGVEAITADERVYIAGCHVIFDFGEMSRQKVEMVFDRRRSKESSRLFQDGIAMRQKGFYYYKEPLIFDIIFKMITMWMAPKLVRRLHRVKNDLKKLHEVCPGSKKLLPKEYGGEAGSLSDCIDRWKQKFHAYWQAQPADRPPIVVDESKRPADSIKYLKQYAEFTGNLGGTQGTYTKIDAM